MATMIQLVVREGCTKYDLYISNYYRDNAFVRLGPKYDNKPKSAFEILYEENPACYETMLNRFKNIQEKNEMLFLGISNSAAVFIYGGLKLLDFANKELKNHSNNAYINRIIITSELEKNSTPQIHPTPLSESFKLKPAYESPVQVKSQPHISVYHTKEPTKFYYPSNN